LDDTPLLLHVAVELLLLLLLLLWSRKELGLAYGNSCTDDEEDIGASQKQNPWQSLSLSLSLAPHDPRAYQVDSNAISLHPPPAHFLAGQTESYRSACKTLKPQKPLNPFKKILDPKPSKTPGTLKGSLYVM
jgi:hypothetical protein